MVTEGQSMLDRTVYRAGRALLALHARLLLDIDIEYQSPLPEGAKILAANHPTTSDALYIASLTSEPVHVLVAGMAFEVPLLGAFLRGAGHLSAAPADTRASFEKAVHLLSEGRTVAIFPEGALSPWQGGLHPPRTGAARLALASGALLVPVGIGFHPERRCRVRVVAGGHPRHAVLYLRGPYALTSGEALSFQGELDDHGRVLRLSECIMGQIAQLAAESARRLQQNRRS
jgi:1-acyl-sn-glycerol-3-phosphate acyltransferase